MINRYDLTTLEFIDQFDLSPLAVGASYVSDTISMVAGGVIVQDSASQFLVEFPTLAPGDRVTFTGFTNTDYNTTLVVSSVDGINQITFNESWLGGSGESGSVITMTLLNDFGATSDIAYGLSVDGTSKVYSVDSDISKALRADIPTLLGELLVGSSGSGDDNFYGPKYSAIVEYASLPIVTAEKTFGNIIW